MKDDEIHDMIENIPVECSQSTILKILNAIDALNDKVNQLEASQSRTANIASCLANGIQPD